MAQTKGNVKMEEQTTAVAEVKEADFSDVELRFDKPMLDKNCKISIGGNYKEVESRIRAVVDRYKNVKLTEENVEYVATLKRQFVSLRTGIDRERKEYKKVYISPAEDFVDTACKELLKIVDEGESALGKQLDEYDQRRKDEITQVLSEHIDFTAQKLGLRDEYKSQIQLKKAFYNKTQDEADSMSDIESQAEELLKKQKDYDNGVLLIKTECEEADFIPDAYIRELQYKSATEIIFEIKADKKKRDEIKTKAEEEGKLTVGATADSELAQQIAKATKFEEKSDEVRTRVLRVTYKAEKAKEMARVLKELCISFELIKTDF